MGQVFEELEGKFYRDVTHVIEISEASQEVKLKNYFEEKVTKVIALQIQSNRQQEAWDRAKFSMRINQHLSHENELIKTHLSSINVPPKDRYLIIGNHPEAIGNREFEIVVSDHDHATTSFKPYKLEFIFKVLEEN